MLPTKGYFQDIECPYYDSSCGRPYCHFRHRKKTVECIEETVSESEKDEISTIPTYKPTPKSELANIHSKSHIPISYVPDLAFRPDRKSRPLPKFDKPTYNPTPLSILSSASKRGSSICEENGEHTEAIKEIKQNIANVEYNPTLSLQSSVDIDFEDLSTEFDLIDEIINSGDKIQRNIQSTHENTGSTLEQETMDLNKISEKVNKSELEIVRKHDNIKRHEKKQEHMKIKEAKNSPEKNEKSEKCIEKKSEKKERHENSDKKERSTEKYMKNDKLKKGKHEKNIDKTEKDEKPKSSKGKSEKPEKHKSSEKEENSGSKERSKKEKSSKEKEKSHKSSCSKEKHIKDEKKDRKEEKHSSSKSKYKSKDRSRSRSKERKKSKEHEKVKEKHCDKDRNSKSKSKTISSSRDRNRDKKLKKIENDKKDYRKLSYEENSDADNDFPMGTDNIKDNVSDLDFDDEDETMMECYKIFNEYKPPEKTVFQETGNMLLEEDFTTVKDDDEKLFGKKRVAHSNAESSVTYSKYVQPPSKPKPINSPGQILTNRYKIAKLAQANREQECIMNEIKHPTAAVKRPAPTLLEAARERKLRKEQSQLKIAEAGCLVDNIIKGTIKTSVPQPTPQQKIIVKKIAPAQNVGLMEKAKERISKIKQTAQTKTIAQTQKSGRVAHIPEVSLSDLPDVLHAEKSKLPVNVRTRFLTMIADECLKLYISKEEAFARALNEEFTCYEKCKVIVTYRNSAMLAVNRLRKEIQERQKLGLGLINLGEDPNRDSSSEFKGQNFYNHVKKWILTEEELDIHGYPRESEEHHGRAIIKNPRSNNFKTSDANRRTCCRCHKIYQVDDDGWPLFEEECLYHPLKKRTIRGEQTYLCCRSNDDAGCATSDTHVSESAGDSELEGFQTTMDPESDNDARNYSIYALDCEMCYTTKGLELTRVSIVDTDCKTVYESLVKPLNPIIDYNTRFSGITKEQMDKTSTSILQIQANILHLCNSRTILVGHSLESDMKALKIVHGTVIDTSVLFPHKMGLPHKRALKALASEYLRKIIQNDISGHDSAEDAITCMELIKWKLKEDLKVRSSK